MPKCSKCKKDVLWAVTANEFAYGSRTQRLDLQEICRNLTSVVQDLRSSWLPVTTTEALDHIVQSLCDDCWKREMGKVAKAEAKPDPTYFDSAAKTTSATACHGSYASGVFLHVEETTYKYFKDPEQDMATALSTVIHELVHYLSAHSTGLQVDEDPVNFDECMTDYFSIKTYFKTFPAMKYHTNYGAKCTFLKLTKKNVWNKFALRLLDNKCAGLKDWPAGMTVYVQDYVDDNPSAARAGESFNQLKKLAARAFVYYMFRTLPAWYFGGVNQHCDDADEWLGKKNATFDDFRRVVTPFVPKQNIGNEFKAYDNAMAPGGYSHLFNDSENSG